MGVEPLRAIEGGGAPRGWERLWPRDVWFQSKLPHGDLASMCEAFDLRDLIDPGEAANA